MRYRDVERVFDLERITEGDTVIGYQLIRNVLSAYEYGRRFLVLCDARRPDLIQEWWKVHSAILDADLRYRSGLLLWQEIARQSPKELRVFLARKYGINGSAA